MIPKSSGQCYAVKGDILTRFHIHKSLGHIGMRYKARHKNKSNGRQSVVTQ